MRPSYHCRPGRLDRLGLRRVPERVAHSTHDGRLGIRSNAVLTGRSPIGFTSLPSETRARAGAEFREIPKRKTRDFPNQFRRCFEQAAEFSLENSDPFSASENGLCNAMNGFLIAKDHDLAGIFDGAISSAVDLVEQKRPAGEPVNIPQTATDHPTFDGGVGLEEGLNPGFRIRLKRALRRHATTL